MVGHSCRDIEAGSLGDAFNYDENQSQRILSSALVTDTHTLDIQGIHDFTYGAKHTFEAVHV